MLDEVFPDEQSEAERELAPSVDVPDESDADPQLQRQFWLLVLVFNVALMALSVGAMLAVFRGQWDTGTSLVAGGLILSAYGLYKYRAYSDEDAAAAASSDSADESSSASGDANDSATDSEQTDESTATEAGSVADLDARSRE